MAAYLAQLLTDSYSATRLVAYRSITELPGFEAFEYDYVGPRSELEDKATEATEIWLGFGGPEQAIRRLLITEDGIDVEEWLRLLGERDERPLAIVE